jgi:flavin-dependent dehydrogenase
MKGARQIEIVGGGLAGLAAGLALRRAGVPVTIYEANGYPRHRVCGEFISGLDGGTTANLGFGEFLAGARPHRGVTYHLRGRPLRPLAIPRVAWGISRHTLDARVARAFAEAGGDLRTHTRAPGGEARPGRVLATGRCRRGRFWVGLKVHVYNLKLVNDFEIHLGDRAYVGLSRVESSAVNVCGIFHRREVAGRGVALVCDYLRACGLAKLAERIAGADVDAQSFCVSAATLRDTGFGPPDTVRIGDAMATIPPFTGNGLAMALQGAELALAPLKAYAFGEVPWEECVRRTAAAQRLRFRRRLLLAHLIHPFLLERRRQACLALLVGLRLLPFRAFYAALR